VQALFKTGFSTNSHWPLSILGIEERMLVVSESYQWYHNDVVRNQLTEFGKGGRVCRGDSVYRFKPVFAQRDKKERILNKLV
jgi:hypothetical protein